jgi:membrane associated rhomboid family serine protease
LRLPWPGWAATGLAALLIGLAAGGAGVREALRWERTGLAAGEAWRLLTGHLVHLDLTHALLNAAGLLLVAALWRGVFRPLQWGVIVVAAVVTIDSGLWFLDSGLEKLAAESWGLGPGSGVIESSLVVTSAHRYGAATGALLGLFYFWSSRASINRTVR